MADLNNADYDDGAFEDPDVTDDEGQYNWSEDYQRTILALLLNDETFLVQSSGLIKSNYFLNEVHQEISRVLFKHFDEYQVLPKRLYISEAIEERIAEKDSEAKFYYRGELNTIYGFYNPGVEDRDYLRDKILDFAKEQAVKVAFYKCMDEFKRNKSLEKWAKISGILNDALSVDRDFDIGEEYFQTYEERYKRMMEIQETGDIFTSGFASIDNALQGGGLGRGEMASWIGLSGSGKSLSLVKGAVANLHQGRIVLYLSTELDKDRVAERFDAQIADPGNRFGVGIKNLIPNREIVFKALGEYTEDYEDKRRLVIKHFPSGQMDVPTFRAYLKQLHMRSFKPDLVVLDYIGEMKDYPNMPTWESRFRMVRDLRGIASEDKFCLMTAMQPGKEARGKVQGGDIIDDDNLADSFGQVRPLDALWSINQRKIEHDAKVARIFVNKHRFGNSRFDFHVEIDIDRTLEIREITKDLYSKRLKEYEMNKDMTNDEAQAQELVAENQRRKREAAAAEKKKKKSFENDPANQLDD